VAADNNAKGVNGGDNSFTPPLRATADATDSEIMVFARVTRTVLRKNQHAIAT
jgi:hypothetical protein